MHDHGIDLFHDLQPEHDAQRDLQGEKYWAGERDEPLLAGIFAAAGNFGAEQDAEEEDEAVVHRAENA